MDHRGRRGAARAQRMPHHHADLLADGHVPRVPVPVPRAGGPSERPRRERRRDAPDATTVGRGPRCRGPARPDDAERERRRPSSRRPRG